MRYLNIALVFAAVLAFGICILAALLNVVDREFADALVWTFLAAVAAFLGTFAYREVNRSR